MALPLDDSCCPKDFSRVLLEARPFTISSAAAGPRLLPFSSRNFSLVFVASLKETIMLSRKVLLSIIVLG